MILTRNGGRPTAALVLVVALLASACGISSSPLEVALGDASSATGSAAVAIRALDEGDITSTVAGTAVDDAVTQIAQAASSVTEHRGAPGPERRLQERAIAVVTRAVRHLHQAQDALTSTEDRARLVRILLRDRDQLEKLSTRAGEIG